MPSAFTYVIFCKKIIICLFKTNIIMVSKPEAELFLNKNVIVIHADGSSAGQLTYVSDGSIILQKNGQKTLISLNSIEKIKERADI